MSFPVCEAQVCTFAKIHVIEQEVDADYLRIAKSGHCGSIELHSSTSTDLDFINQGLLMCTHPTVLLFVFSC